MKRRAALALAVLALTMSNVEARQHRSRHVTQEFQRLHPCPSTGLTYGACPGYVKDHIIALCKGGADSVTNIQWQTVYDAKMKDKWECK